MAKNNSNNKSNNSNKGNNKANNKGNNKANNKGNNKGNNKANNKTNNKGNNNSDILFYIIIAVILLFLYSNYVVNDNIIEEESSPEIEEESIREAQDNFMNTDEYQTKVLYLMNRRKNFIKEKETKMVKQISTLKDMKDNLYKLKEDILSVS